MFITADQSVLLIIDVQGKLAMRMHEKSDLVRNLRTLIQAAKIFNIPIISTEQAPEKIGDTISEIKELLDDVSIKKTRFSCCQEPQFGQRLSELKRHKVLVTGIEAHVCVYQTVSELREQQFDVEVVADAVSSRSLADKQLALERIKLSGATLTNTEMLICELMQGADHPKFKEIMTLLK